MKRKLLPYHKYKTIDNFAIDMSNWHDANPHPISHFMFLAIGIFLCIGGISVADSGGLLFFGLGAMFIGTGFMGFMEDGSKNGDSSWLFNLFTRNGDSICNAKPYIQQGEIPPLPYKPIYKNKKSISAAQANREIKNIQKFYTGTYRPLNGQKEKCPFYDTPHYISR